MLKEILFDVDATLAQTEDTHRKPLHWAFAQHGIDGTWYAAKYRERRQVTGGKERKGAYFRQRGRPLTDEQIDALHCSKNALLALLADSLGGGSACPRPGVLRLMRAARERGSPLASATTASQPNIDALARDLVAGEHVARKKPSPSVYRWRLARLDTAAAAALVPDLGQPQSPWKASVPGFDHAQARIEDSRRPVARREIAPWTEMAQ
ncbi:HAD-superfamily hydrolase subfamily IA, variant 3 (fragment) [Burkholderiales bacterium]